MMHKTFCEVEDCFNLPMEESHYCILHSKQKNQKNQKNMSKLNLLVKVKTGSSLIAPIAIKSVEYTLLSPGTGTTFEHSISVLSKDLVLVAKSQLEKVLPIFDHVLYVEVIPEYIPMEGTTYSAATLCGLCAYAFTAEGAKIYLTRKDGRNVPFSPAAFIPSIKETLDTSSYDDDDE